MYTSPRSPHLFFPCFFFVGIAACIAATQGGRRDRETRHGEEDGWVGGRYYSIVSGMTGEGRCGIELGDDVHPVYEKACVLCFAQSEGPINKKRMFVDVVHILQTIPI